MPWTVKYKPYENIVLIESKGDLAIEDVRAADAEAKLCARENETNRFLYDDSEACLQFSFMDFYELHGSWEDVGFSVRDKVAVICPFNPIKKKKYDFFETVCINRGLQVKMFVDKPSALEWLANQ